MSLPLTQDEKIDYIYKHIKSEKRNKIFKILIKVSLVFVLYFWIQYIITNIWTEQIRKTISTQIWDITAPIVKDLVKDLNTNSENWMDPDLLIEIIKNDPELLDKIKKYDY
jgi:hypothetical protein